MSRSDLPKAPAVLVGPLKGATLVVTRPRASADTLKRRIVALDGSVLALPGIGLRAVADAAAAKSQLRTARDAELVVFTSPAAVRHAFALIPRLRFSRATGVFAIGVSTARALARRGIDDVQYPPSRQDSEGLLALPAFIARRRRRVVLIGAAGGRDAIAPALRERGARVDEIFVYERTAPRLTRRHFAALEQARRPLVTLLSSVDALRHLKAQLPLHLYARLADGELVASSERVAQAARAGLFANVHVAASAQAQALVEAATAALARHRL